MIGQLINLNLFAFLMVFSRIGTAFMIMPGFGSQQIPINARIAFALAVSFILTPMLMEFIPLEPTEVSVLALLLASEILIGVFLGLIPRVFMAALQVAGTILAMVASMANMFIQDPIAEQQSSLLSTFLGIMALTIIFVTNTHHLMIAALADSYSLFPPVGGPMVADMTDYLAHKVAESFTLGVQLSAPLIVSGVAYYFGLGIMGRLMPSVPVFFFGMPIQIAMQFWLLIMSLSAMMMVFMQFFEGNLYYFAAPLGG